MQIEIKNKSSLIVVTALIFISLGMSKSLADLVGLEQAISVFTDPEGRVSEVVTGDFGDPLETKNSLGLTTTFIRDDDGNPITTTYPSGLVVTRNFDSRGNLIAVTDEAIDGTYSITYDSVFNKPKVVTDPFLGNTIFQYDESGNLVNLTTAGGREISATYQSNGQLESYTDPSGTVSNFSYNADRLPIETVTGIGEEQRLSSVSYDSFGNESLRVDAEGQTSTFEYDSFNRITRVNYPEDQSVSYEYNSAGHMTNLTTPNGNEYSFEYNHFGRLLSQQYPSVAGGGTNEKNFRYNNAGELTKITRADDVEIDIVRDNAGRIQTIIEPRGNYTINYSDVTGLVDSLSSPDGVIQTHSYDNGLLIDVNWSGNINGSVGYAYDIKGRISSLNIAGKDVNYEYNADDDITQAGDESLTYDDISGLLISTSLDTLSESFTYNQFSELSRHTVDNGATIIYDVQYSRDKLGRITQKIETISDVTVTSDYTYDLVGRLETVTQDNILMQTYSFDSSDNRTDNGASYDVQDRITQQTGIVYSYNSEGERTRKTKGSDVTEYQYDALGTIIGATLPDNGEIAYTLDGQGRRVSRALDGITTESWLYIDTINPIAQLDESNAVTQRYIYSRFSHVPNYIEIGDIQYKIIYDHLGSARLVVNAATGEIAQRLDYDPWGVVTLDSNPGFQIFGFAGGIYDSATELVQFGYREYDAETAHWLRKDPSHFSGSLLNLYSYAHADPINLMDKNGLEPTSSAPPQLVGKVIDIDGPGATFSPRGKGSFQLTVGQNTCLTDEFTADKDTTITLEFLAGGRAVVSSDTTMKITSPRKGRIVKKRQSPIDNVWDAMNNFSVKSEEFQIQTSGGVIGIEG